MKGSTTLPALEQSESRLVTYDGKAHFPGFLPTPLLRRSNTPRTDILVVIVPGAEPGLSHFPLGNALLQFCDVAILDSGFSGEENIGEGFSAGTTYMNLYQQFVNVARGRRVILIGHSIGAALATLLCADRRMRRGKNGIRVHTMLWIAPAFSVQHPLLRPLSWGIRVVLQTPLARHLIDLSEVVNWRLPLTRIVEILSPGGVPLSWYRDRAERAQERHDLEYERLFIDRLILWNKWPAAVIAELLDHAILAWSELPYLSCGVRTIWAKFDVLVQRVPIRRRLARNYQGEIEYECGHFANYIFPAQVAGEIEQMIAGAGS